MNSNLLKTFVPSLTGAGQRRNDEIVENIELGTYFVMEQGAGCVMAWRGGYVSRYAGRMLAGNIVYNNRQRYSQQSVGRYDLYDGLLLSIGCWGISVPIFMN